MQNCYARWPINWYRAGIKLLSGEDKRFIFLWSYLFFNKMADTEENVNGWVPREQE